MMEGDGMGSRHALKRVPSRFVASFAACMLFVALPGCSAVEVRAPRIDAAHEATGTSAHDATLTIREQASIVSGRKDVRLDPIPGAQAWLGNGSLAAYVDPSSHDEYIADESRGLLLSYMPGTEVYQDPLNLAGYPGEPPRAEVLRLADDWARKYSPKHDISTMRRTAKRRVAGTGPKGHTLEYSVEYRRYVNGVRMPEWVIVEVTLSSWSWRPSRSLFEHSGAFQKTPPPVVTMLEAVKLASTAAGIAHYRVESADLAVWEGQYYWDIELDNASPSPRIVGNQGALVRIDAMSGVTGGIAR